MANKLSYEAAPEVEKIVRRLISDRFSHLATVRVECVFRSEPAVKAGKVTWATARKVTGLNAWLAMWRDGAGLEADAEEFFVIEVAKPVWLAMKPEQREPLIFHELCHCHAEEDENGQTRLTLLGHDLEEFTEVVKRYGLWREDVEQFLKATKQQLALFESQAAVSGIALRINQDKVEVVTTEVIP